MKCRYTQCSLGGEVEKEDAVYTNKMYYHKECFDKYNFKIKMREVLKKFPKKDIDITLKNAIDDIKYPLGYIEYVAILRFKDFKTAYNLLYHLKVEDNYKKYMQSIQLQLKVKLSKEIKSMDLVADNNEFEYKPTVNKRLNIY